MYLVQGSSIWDSEVNTDELLQLQSLKAEYISSRFYHHYKGFFHKKCTEYNNRGNCPIKPLLYIYRVALTGIHLLLTGEVIGDVNITGPEYGFREVAELVQIYSVTSEKECLDVKIAESFFSKWPLLQEKLDQALEKTCLPEIPRGKDVCSEWLIELRLRGLIG